MKTGDQDVQQFGVRDVSECERMKPSEYVEK